MVNLPSLLGIDDGGRAIAQGKCGVRGENRDGFGLGEELVYLKDTNGRSTF